PVEWPWMLFGLGLMLLELLAPILVAFWFGMGAMLVSCILFVKPDIGLNTQLVLWIVASVVLLVGWYVVFKRYAPDRTRAGLARKTAIGACGQLLSVPVGGSPGRVRFTTPLLGAGEWPVISEEDTLVEGDRVWVVAVSGNTLVVSGVSPSTKVETSSHTES
ncbi:MAG: NfeD family protein, partial [Gammaproteobacteria bacterium]